MLVDGKMQIVPVRAFLNRSMKPFETENDNI